MSGQEAPPGATQTAWLPAEAEPIHEGVYRRRWPAGPFSCWSQGQWYGDAATADLAASQLTPSTHQDALWAGLDAPPDEPCWLCRGHGVVDFGVDNDSGNDLIDPCPEC